MNDPITHPTQTADSPSRESLASPAQAPGVKWLPPIHVRIPHIRPTGYSKLYAESTESTVTGLALPTFEGVDAALDQTPVRGPCASRPRSIRTRHPAHVSRFKIQSKSAVGPSWRSVVLLVLVLLAAAGMTFWITNGATQTTPAPTIESTPWERVPPPMAGNRAPSPDLSNSPSTFEQLPGDAIDPPDIPRNTPSLGASDFSCSVDGSDVSNHVADQGPSAFGPIGQGRIARYPGPAGPYQATDRSYSWQFTPVESGPDPAADAMAKPSTDQAENMDPSHPTTAPVSFKGHIEPPNLRARYDRQRSILH